MAKPEFDLEKAHRWFAANANNAAWALVDQTHLDPAAGDRLLHLAHSACYHWMEVGTPIQHQRALVLVAEAHAALGYGASAVRFAGRAWDLGEDASDEMKDWDWAFSWDCRGRAAAAAGDIDQAETFKAAAGAAGEAISDPEDKKVFMASFTSGNWHGVD